MIRNLNLQTLFWKPIEEPVIEKPKHWWQWRSKKHYYCRMALLVLKEDNLNCQNLFSDIEPWKNEIQHTIEDFDLNINDIAMIQLPEKYEYKYEFNNIVFGWPRNYEEKLQQFIKDNKISRIRDIDYPILLTKRIPSLIDHCKGPKGWFRCKVALLVKRKDNLKNEKLFLEDMSAWEDETKNYHNNKIDLAIIEVPEEFIAVNFNIMGSELKRINLFIKEMGIK